MKLTKTLFGIFIVAGCFFNPCAPTTVIASGNNELCTVAVSSSVYLKGRLSTPTTRSMSQPIEVFLEDKALMIYYSCELGEMEITISDERNSIVYSEVVSISKSTKSLIELTGFSNGNYTLRFKNIDGEELIGKFVIE